MRLSIVIPIYNEEDNIHLLIDRLNSLINRTKINTEVILVDDHSEDQTQSLINQYCAKYEYLKYIRLSKNNGSHVAILAGLKYAKGDCGVFLSADLQDPPELIEEMLKLWKEGYDVVWAVRKEIKGVSLLARFFSASFYKIFNLLSPTKLPPKGADFALIDRKIIDGILVSAGSTPIIDALTSWMGYRQTTIPYVKEERKHGRTKWTFSKKLIAFADAFVDFSYFPVRLMSFLGILFAIFGFIYAGIIVFTKIVYNMQVQGYASLVILILVMGGLQMIMLGILGEYLWRNVKESKKRPLYFIEEKKGF